jgi:hypothetical protein
MTKETLMRDPLLPQVDGIHVPGSRPILSDTFHRVPSNRLTMLPFGDFLIFDGFSLVVVVADDDASTSSSFLVLVETTGDGGGSNGESLSFRSISFTVDDAVVDAVNDIDVFAVEVVVVMSKVDTFVGVLVDDKCSLNFSNRRRASFFSSLISSRRRFDSASISDTVLVVLLLLVTRPLLSMSMTILLLLVVVDMNEGTIFHVDDKDGG